VEEEILADGEAMDVDGKVPTRLLYCPHERDKRREKEREK